MKLKIYLLLPVFLIVEWPEAFCQKEDYHWILGYSLLNPSSDTNFGRSEFIFSDSSIEIKKTFKLIHKLDFTNASICDSNGKLLFYTNGLEVYNNNYEVMPNGDDLNPGEFANNSENFGYSQTGGALILPWPGHFNSYFLIHMTTDRIPFKWYSLNLLTTLVDMNLENGKGNVVYKNKSVYSDSLGLGSLTACRHANGRDWWIPSFYYSGKKCFLFLLDPNGIRLHHVIDIPFNFESSGSGQATFSPDGTKYSFIHTNSLGFREFYLAHFDRCDGVFTKQYYSTINGSDPRGVAFSAKSLFLYLATGTKLFQLDMSEDIPFQTKLLVDTIDGFESIPSFPSYFHLMQLAPNGKIYICNGRSPKHLSTIENPDLKGTDCNIKQHNIEITANSTMPNLPYFRLGAIIGSTCDTLTNTEHPQNDSTNIYKIQFNFFPNPVSEILNITFSKNLNQNLWIDIFDLFGHKVISNHIFQGTNNVKINVSNIPSGMYLLKLRDKTGIIGLEKVIIE
jgi:hypothetical protein